jgi:hypothetical protein
MPHRICTDVLASLFAASLFGASKRVGCLDRAATTLRSTLRPLDVGVSGWHDFS